MIEQFNKEKNREPIEWSNTWISDAQHFNAKRILLIGDSVSREYRGCLDKQLTGYVVDFIGTSSSLEDTLLYNLCDMFHKDTCYQYPLILVNIAGKHGFYLNTEQSQTDALRYNEAFKNFINYLKKTFSSEIVLLTTTPNVLPNNIKKYDEKTNKEIRSRNDIQMNIAKEFGLNIIDLYNVVEREKLKYKDTKHFASKKQQQILAKNITEHLQKLKLIKLSPPHIKKKFHNLLLIEKIGEKSLKFK